MKIKIIHDTDIEKFTQKCNAMLEDGWKFRGDTQYLIKENIREMKSTELVQVFMKEEHTNEDLSLYKKILTRLNEFKDSTSMSKEHFLTILEGCFNEVNHDKTL